MIDVVTKIVIFVCSGTNDRINGAGHGNQVNGLVCSSEAVYSCGIDDTFRKAGLGEAGAAGDYGAVAVALGSQPRAMDYHKEKNTVVVTTVKEVTICLLLLCYLFSPLASRIKTNSALGKNTGVMHLSTVLSKPI